MSLPQKRTAHPPERRLGSAIVRVAGFVAAVAGMGIVGFLIGHQHNGILTASLATTLTTIAFAVRGR